MLQLVRAVHIPLLILDYHFSVCESFILQRWGFIHSNGVLLAIPLQKSSTAASLTWNNRFDWINRMISTVKLLNNHRPTYLFLYFILCIDPSFSYAVNHPKKFSSAYGLQTAFSVILFSFYLFYDCLSLQIYALGWFYWNQRFSKNMQTMRRVCSQTKKEKRNKTNGECKAYNLRDPSH